jgi:FkbM family methyltransferase
MEHFFDVGAHNGNTFEFLGDYKNWKIWCFEPSPRHTVGLLDHATSSDYNITVCPFGLGGKTQAVQFFQKNDRQADSFLQAFSENNRLGYDIITVMYDISEFILKHTKEEDIIHLKLDCEGAEYEILQSLLDNPKAFDRVKKLMVEFHDVGDCEVKRKEFAEACEKVGHPVENWGH